MTRRKLAIIGNGMATSRLLDELSRRGGLQMFEVTVFGEEPHGAYNRILLNRILEGGAIDDITLKPAAWYAEQGVRFYPGRVVSRLSHAARRLWTDDGSEHFFHAAVFATGSVSRVPTVEGYFREDGRPKGGVFAYRTAADVERMRVWARPGQRAVVVGGGLLGLEAAKGLVDLGLEVTVAHLFETLMNRQVDQTGGQFLRRAIERLGITVRTSVNTKAVLGSDRVEGLQFGAGERLPADMVVFASGIKPRVDLAKDSDVPTNAGILADDRLETQLPGLYAVGECAEHAGTVYGTVQPIYEQCAVLADTLTGANPAARYRGSKVYTKLKVAGVEVASMGAVEAGSPDDEVVQVVEEKRSVYRKLIIRGDRLAGAVLVGDSSAAAGLVRVFDNRSPLPENRLDLLASGEAIPGSSAGNDPEVCNCHHVSTSTLVAEIRGGCDTLARLSNKTKAGTGCGSCRGQLADLILKNAPVTAGRAKG
ncbi:FAD-dependent oxidoreductase [Zavarzinella formosa]|uniref:FAD-dependent oxidoreductase n=1 Tax=Zavarzinella formosa TaxID=360055 RepID=UPI0002E46FE5|nr:FAD-dependent oxidoreductase [Zavarzinella formosa]